jgi:anhydro-N-acetylmuramic acid kinase
MSGTSLDGVEVCLAQFSLNTKATPRELPVQVEDVQHLHLPMPWRLKESLLAIQQPQNTTTLAEVTRLNRDLGHWFAESTLEALDTFEVEPNEVFCLASHGQTVYHQPPQGRVEGCTLQLGEPAIIAEATGLAVVADFRPADMAVGGHGAPLVPFADALLLAHPTRTRCVQNMGGIGNVTVVPPLNAPQHLMAFDTGPGNMLIDAATTLWFGQAYDPEGRLAAMGQVVPAFLKRLQQHPFLALVPPKSTGREAFGVAYLQEALKGFEAEAKEDLLATLTEFTAYSVAQAYEQFVLPHYAVDEVLLCGGGVYNATLVAALERQLAATAYCQRNRKTLALVSVEEAGGFPNPAKEALAFGLMGWAYALGLPNHVPQCTGAQGLRRLGKLCDPHGRLLGA